MRVALEVGPRGKRVVAVAPDWPGLSRGAKDAASAVERLLTYIPRYAPVAALAGMAEEFAVVDGAEVVEEYAGTGSTDFWGISFAFSSSDNAAVAPQELERELALLQAAWAYFDLVRARVSPEMKRGPRGGGRDRDHIVRHTLAAELDWSPKLGIRQPLETLLTDEGLREHRAAYVAAIRTLHAEGKPARTWPLRYLIRHTAFHTLDHTWEMEDKDLTPKPA
ncbi:MAG: hypothetical protein DCC58_11845 [Chloroflexi bacterium]|nr:MAG: hypothetical protein DCC58_11845 [Chloroflexota bacterium]